MKELEINLTKNGFNYKQILKSDKGYVYEQSMDGRVIAYEVFERKENTQYNCISFPTSNAFGIWAWTYWHKEDAIAKFNTL